MTQEHTQENAISFEGICKRFGTFKAVDHLSFQVGRGEAFGFLGPNGSGKTTTVRLMSGLLLPDSGAIHIAGLDLACEAVAIKRQMGVVSGTESLFKRVTLWEHLLMVGHIHGLDPEVTTQRAESLLRFADLWEKRGTYAHEASHGMQRKLLLGMALIHNPRILILDEPFEGLDPLSVRRLSELIGQLSAAGVTLFITSHLLHEVEKLVNHFVIINEGKVLHESNRTQLQRDGDSMESLYYSFLEKPLHERITLPWLG